MSHHSDRLGQSLWCFGVPVLWFGLSVFTALWLYHGVAINPARYLVFFILLAFIFITPCWFVYRKRYGLLGPGEWSKRLMVRLCVMMFLIAASTSLFATEDTLWINGILDFSSRGWLSVVLAIVIMGPVVEEIVFRGFLLQGLLTWLPNSRLVCAILVSLLFTAGHTQYSSGITVVELMSLSLLFCYARFASKGLLLPVLLHMLNNAISVVWYYLSVN